MNRGTIPMETAIRECNEIYERLKGMCDGRSMLHCDLSPIFQKNYSHGRSYQGYFRDMNILRSSKKPPIVWSLDKDQVIDENWIKVARHRRNQHRQNSAFRRGLARSRMEETRKEATQ